MVNIIELGLNAREDQIIDKQELPSYCDYQETIRGRIANDESYTVNEAKKTTIPQESTIV